MAVSHSERQGENGLRETGTATGWRLKELDLRPRSATVQKEHVLPLQIDSGSGCGVVRRDATRLISTPEPRQLGPGATGSLVTGE